MAAWAGSMSVPPILGYTFPTNMAVIVFRLFHSIFRDRRNIFVYIPRSVAARTSDLLSLLSRLSISRMRR